MRNLTLFIALFSIVSSAKGADGASAFAQAKQSYQELKKDAQRRKLRHHWQNVAKKFESVALKFPKSKEAPDALLRAGEMLSELARFSSNDEDVNAAKKAYQKFLESYPKSKLADDVAFNLAKLHADDHQVSAARKVAEQGLKSANDKKKELQNLLAALPVEKRVEKISSKKPEKIERPLKWVAVKQSEAPRETAVHAKNAAVEERTKPVPQNSELTRQPEAHAKSAEVKVEAEEEAPVATEATEEERRSADALVNALRKASAHIDDEKAVRINKTREPIVVASRRADTIEVEKESSDEVNEHQTSALESLKERLRDVRVGERTAEETSTEKKSRFKKLARSEEASEVSLAQQLGLKVRRVIVDAGHGGHDTGAIGAKGTKEKDVALLIAKKVAKKLEAQGLEVLLTRDDDTFVKLEDRTRFANQNHGDLFISIHCNAAPTKSMRGVETYTLNTSANRYSIRLAARENATTERGVGDLQYILADLATKTNTGESERLAERVQQSIVQNLSSEYKNVKSLGTKEALFFVLLGAKMPAILVETSFLSHPEEELRLADGDYQENISDSISQAVEGFLEERNKLAKLVE
jgi:N-acetylmuramoyl-L-alanine amidase